MLYKLEKLNSKLNCLLICKQVIQISIESIQTQLKKNVIKNDARNIEYDFFKFINSTFTVENPSHT